MQRRTFLATTSAGLTAALARPLMALPKSNPYMKSIGLQLYTLRNELQRNVPGTIKAVADAGYRQVEMMQVVGSEPIVGAAKDNGLKITSAMMNWETIVNPGKEGVPKFHEILETASKIGLKFLVIPYVGKGSRETANQLKQLAQRANRAGAVCQKAGIQLCYHHHSFEFGKLESGQTGWNIFVKEFDPTLVKFEIDAFWAKVGGKNPVKTILDLKGRVAQLHLKDVLKGTPTIYDESKVPHEAFKEVGNGIIDWPAVLQAAEQAGVTQCHVEQDQSPDPIASIGQSIKYLKTLC